MDSRRWNDESVAVVTGGNKGIGLEVCRQLAEKGLKVVLTARDETRGRHALETLAKKGLHNVQFHPLDVTDDGSVSALATWLVQEHGGLDILVNNAGVISVTFCDGADGEARVVASEEVSYDSAKECVDTNYYGMKRVTKALIPLLRSSPAGARIINVGSDYGQLCHLQSTKLQEKLGDVDNLSESFLDEMLENFLNDVKNKRLHEGKVWPVRLPHYKTSKVAMHTYTRLLARELKMRHGNERIFVNCTHPGFVKTDLTRNTGNMSSCEGAENVVSIVLLPREHCPSGQFFYEGKLASF